MLTKHNGCTVREEGPFILWNGTWQYVSHRNFGLVHYWQAGYWIMFRNLKPFTRKTPGKYFPWYKYRPSGENKIIVGGSRTLGTLQWPVANM